MNRLPARTRFVLGQLIGKGPLRDARSAHELDQRLSALRGNWLGFVVPCGRRLPSASSLWISSWLASGWSAGLAEALGAFDRQRVTVRLGDSAEQTKELEYSDFEESWIKSELAFGRKDHVLTWSRRLRVDRFRARAHMRVSRLQEPGRS